eukprot:351377-Chlamydomonas_euryale.AAC.10
MDKQGRAAVWRGAVGGFVSLWAHTFLLPTLQIVSVVPVGSSEGWPPGWSLLRGAASTFKPYAALLRLWH